MSSAPNTIDIVEVRTSARCTVIINAHEARLRENGGHITNTNTKLANLLAEEQAILALQAREPLSTANITTLREKRVAIVRFIVYLDALLEFRSCLVAEFRFWLDSLGDDVKVIHIDKYLRGEDIAARSESDLEELLAARKGNDDYNRFAAAPF